MGGTFVKSFGASAALRITTEALKGINNKLGIINPSYAGYLRDTLVSTLLYTKGSYLELGLAASTQAGTYILSGDMNKGRNFSNIILIGTLLSDMYKNPIECGVSLLGSYAGNKAVDYIVNSLSSEENTQTTNKARSKQHS